jgi:hypothetical protein
MVNDVIASITDAFTHRPFDCDSVSIFELADDKPLPCDEDSKRLWEQHRHPIAFLAQEKTQPTRVWFGDIQKVPGQEVLNAVCYGGCRVGTVIVVLAKRLAGLKTEAQMAGIFDDHFFNVMARILAEILGVPLRADQFPSKDPAYFAVGGLEGEMRALERLEKLWRDKYGKETWLAIKDQTVQAVGQTRREVEQQIEEKGVESPVLYVPPEHEDHVLHVYSARF